MSHFYRNIRTGKTTKGTHYTVTMWWSGARDVTVCGATFRAVTDDEMIFLVNNF